MAFPEAAPERMAILMLGPKTVEAVVDITARTVASWREVPGVQPDITEGELFGQDEIAKASPEVLAALKRRGSTDLTWDRWRFHVSVEPRRGVVEAEAKLDRHEPALWRIVNPAVKGPMATPRATRSTPVTARSRCSTRTTTRSGGRLHRARPLVTPYRPEEQYAAGDYPTQSHGGDGLPAWTAANRPIEHTDIVAWYP